MLQPPEDSGMDTVTLGNTVLKKYYSSFIEVDGSDSNKKYNAAAEGKVYDSALRDRTRNRLIQINTAPRGSDSDKQGG